MPERNYDRINRFCDHAVEIALDDSHGYSQYNRWGSPDYDCSSLMYECAYYAGYDIKYEDPRYTGSMIDDFAGAGYRVDEFDGNLWDLERGDILLNTGAHTAVYIGDGQIVEASNDEDGGIAGNQPGDQTGWEIHIGDVYNYPWTHVLTPPEDYDITPDPEPEPEPEPGEIQIFLIDVSEHNGEIDWQAVKDSGWHAIIRVGYGDNIEDQDDEYYWYNIGECERLGIPHGVYLYSYAQSMDQVQSEIDHMLRLIDGKTLQYPVFFDTEEPGTEWISYEATCEFCSAMERAGYWAGVYASESWWNANLHGLWDHYATWVAKWGSNDGSMQEPPYCPYDIWQYSSEGGIPGVYGRVDVSMSTRDFPKEITGESGGTPTPGPSPAPEPEPGPAPSGDDVDSLADRVIAGEFGEGQDRIQALGDLYDVVQAIVNNRYGVGFDVDNLAQRVIAGDFGNGDDRRRALGSIYDIVQQRVNEILGSDIDDLAYRTIRGEFGNGADRIQALGGLYDAVQQRVNEILGA